MELRSFASAADFLRVTEGFLAERGAEDNLIWGVAHELTQREPRSGLPPYWAAVLDGERVIAAAMRTPPHPLVITRTTDEALKILADDLERRGVEPSGVTAETGVAKRFAAMWSARTGRGFRMWMNHTIYELRQIKESARVSGRCRVAQKADTERVWDWWGRFEDEAMGADAERASHEVLETYIRQKRVYFWEDTEPVSLAVVVRKLPRWGCVGGVYTPPEQRGRGYASACVGAVCEYLLAEGSEFVCLFADRDNPISNHLYQKIGFRPLVDGVIFRFTAREERPRELVGEK
ncbi:MAG: GNAT family N-acetyltransferase [Candidatus Lernaella stagnicola]|nr:GNAT family N-acetyltransferase [Candidatus Lernaella stagnicola]